jgi:hypothetical protein
MEWHEHFATDKFHLLYLSLLYFRSMVRSVRFGVWSRKLSNVGQSLDGWQKIYYFELLRASEGTLSRWSRLHLQSLAPTPGLTSGRRPVVKIIAESLSLHDEKQVVPTPLSGIRVGERKKSLLYFSSMAPRTVRHVFAEVKQFWSIIGWVSKNLLSRACPCPSCICDR